MRVVFGIYGNGYDQSGEMPNGVGALGETLK